MKKNNCKGFILVETLVVTTFVAGVLIFLFVQFSKLSKAYEESYIYNTVEGLYALEDVRDFLDSSTITSETTITDPTNEEETITITSTNKFIEYIKEQIETENYIDITDCTLFDNKDYCLNLLQSENIDRIFITKNSIPNNITGYKEGFQIFISKINNEGNEPFRIVASFDNSTYATLRFGD